MILTGLKLKKIIRKYKLNCGMPSQLLKRKMKKKTPKNCSEIGKKSLFFHFLRKKSFLNRTLGLSKFFLNQTTYVLKNWL